MDTEGDDLNRKHLKLCEDLHRKTAPVQTDGADLLVQVPVADQRLAA